jgi:poly(3-hydroxybutyrate) depolymerase
MRAFCSRLVLLSTLVAAHAEGAQTVALPAWVCAHPDAVFAGGFEAGQNAVPSDPSHGSGGGYPGNRSRNLHIAGLGSGTQTYYLYLPLNYTPARSWPVILALHGVAPNDGGSYAFDVRATWAPVAAAAGFIVAAPIADDVVNVNGQPGITWRVPPTTGPNDYDLFDAIRADLEDHYNVERTRVYGWGFSSGGHVMHDLGLTQHSTAFNASTMAAYSVSGGDLAGQACKGLLDSACNQLLASLPRKIPVDIHIGTADPNYTYAQSDAVRFPAQGWITGQTFFWTAFSGGHDYSTADLQQVWTNLCPNAVVP